MEIPNIDYKKYYDLEKYIFSDVSAEFKSNGYLSAFSFFCIVIWKANRAKSRIAKRLLYKDKIKQDSLEIAVKNLTSSISKESNDKEKLRILIEEWKFRLPMASAILTVLYPERFTVYDTRVCEVLGKYQYTQQKVNFENMWNEYHSYIDDVNGYSNKEKNLREKDKFIWGKAFKNQLEEDISKEFHIT